MDSATASLLLARRLVTPAVVSQPGGQLAVVGGYGKLR